MHPSDSIFLDRLQADSIRYVIPVYQRMYSWDRTNCEQLWKDIVAIGESEGGKHFTGSIVWVQDGGMDGSGEITALLIDGQQRMTTLSLLLIALADYGRKHKEATLDYKWKRVIERYLLHDEDLEPGDVRRYKLTLSEEDNNTFHSLIDELTDESIEPVRTSDAIVANYELFKEMIEGIADPNVIWRGIRKLQVISVSLEQGIDNPQAIFESMNSTGKDLSAADLVRNYVLMGLPVKEQNKLYKNYWRPIERFIGNDNRDERFDEFLKDYLTVVCAPEPINLKDVYAVFKRRVVANDWRSTEDIEQLLAEMKRYAGYYSRIALGAEKDPALSVPLANLCRFGVTVVNPLIMEFFDASEEDRGRLDKKSLQSLFEIAESYLVRRAVCNYMTNSLSKFFGSVIAKLRALGDDLDYAKAFAAYLEIEAGTARRFPGDHEFVQALRSRNLYSFRKVLYLLNRLENSYHAKNNPVDFSTGQYSIEHIMPQNALAHEEWIEMLGGEEAATQTHEELLHTLGNLTVTAYNSELSDGLFEEKKARMEGGFDHDIISLSADCKEAKVWNRESIEARARRLADKAKSVWPANDADQGLVDQLGKKAKKTAGIGETVTLKALIDDGYLNVGATLVHDGDAGRYTAKITEDAKVMIYNGELFNSLSLAAIRCIELRTGTKRAQNGWFYWHLDDASGTVLDGIRNRYREDKGLNNDMSDWDTWHIAFWEGFYELTSEMPDFCDAFGDLTERKPNKGYYCDLATGITGRYVSLNVFTSKKNLGVCCGEWFNDPTTYADFYNKKTEIEQTVGTDGVTWKWDEPSTTKKTRYPNVHKHFDVNDEAQRVEAYEWLVEMVWEFKRIFN